MMTQTTTIDRLLDKVSGICLIAAPLLSAISSPLRFNQATLFAAGLTQMYACVLFIPALLGLARLLRHAAPRLALIGGLLGILGSVGGVNFATLLLYEWAARTAGADESTVRAITETVQSRLWPALSLPTIMFPISFLILSVGIIRTGVTPKWVGGLLCVAAIIFPLGRIPDIQALFHLSDLLLFIPLAWIGLRCLASATPQGVAVPATA
ncbi:MAG TPA: hypothetical protein VIL85_24840 [Thermomicrobiales bacterium]|jgi:hypothetical protein